jgi:hypothetical protein
MTPMKSAMFVRSSFFPEEVLRSVESLGNSTLLPHNLLEWVKADELCVQAAKV